MTKFPKLVTVLWTGLRELRCRLGSYVGDISGDDARSLRRRNILEAATELFVRQGYRGTSIDQVADAVGIAKGTIYLHFKTKIELLVAASSAEKLKYLAQMEPLFDASIPPEQRLRSWLTTALLLPREMPLAAKIMAQGELPAVVEAMPQELLDESAQVQNQTLGQLLREVAAHRAWTDSEMQERLVVVSAVTLLSGMINDDRMRRGVTIERFVEVLSQMLVDGLVGPVMLAERLPQQVLRSTDKGSKRGAFADDSQRKSYGEINSV